MKEIILTILKKYRWNIIVQLFFITVNIYILTKPPKIIGKIIDLLYNIPANYEHIITQTVLLLAVCLLLLIIRVIWKYFDTYIPRALERDLKDDMFKHLMKLKLNDIQGIKNGEIMSYFVKDVSEIRVVVQRVLSYGTRIVDTFIIVTVSMIVNVDLKLTLITLIPICITGYIIVVIKKYIQRSYQKSQLSFTKLSEFVQESTDAIRTTKAYSGEEQQVKEFIKINKKLKSCNNSVDVHSTLLSTSVNIGFGLCYGLSILFGTNLIINNIISVGDFIAFNSYITLFVGPVSWLPSLISRIKRAQVSYSRLDTFFSLETEVLQIEEKKKQENLKGKIQINDLSFNYPQCIDKVLNHISIEIKEGETLGIIGTIGSGKTTLMNLLTRLYTVPKGMITIDNKDINDIPLKVLRDNICYITQDNFLFSTTLKENINLFRDGYKEEEIIESTKKSIIYDEIMNMSDGIHTVIGERGVDLSGGQKQRIVISRTFLNKSNIIIFDDTFSALDNKTEEFLLENIRELTKEKTCIIISNRISDIKDSNKIIVVEEGEIIQQGTHDSLIQEKGKYQEFYKQQTFKKLI